MYQLDWGMGHPHIGLNVILDMSVKIVLDDVNI